MDVGLADSGSNRGVEPKTHFKTLQPQRLLVHGEGPIKKNLYTMEISTHKKVLLIKYLTRIDKVFQGKIKEAVKERERALSMLSHQKNLNELVVF